MTCIYCRGRPVQLPGAAFLLISIASASQRPGLRQRRSPGRDRARCYPGAGPNLRLFELPTPELPEGASERAAAMAGEIDRSPYGNGLGGRLAERVLGGMATDLVPLKPKRLAASPRESYSTAICRPCSVYLEPTHSLDVVKGVGLVTEVTLLDTSAALPGDFLIHHRKMHHEMTGRCLMALIAVL